LRRPLENAAANLLLSGEGTIKTKNTAQFMLWRATFVQANAKSAPERGVVCVLDIASGTKSVPQREYVYMLLGIALLSLVGFQVVIVPASLLTMS
jgi:hypothetical protein